MIADDFETIRLRMAEIEAEKKRAPAESAVEAAAEHYLGGEDFNRPHEGLTLDWAIYAPYTSNNVNG